MLFLLGLTLGGYRPGVAGSLLVTMGSLKTRVTQKITGPRGIGCQSSVLGSSHACELFRTFIQLVTVHILLKLKLKLEFLPFGEKYKKNIHMYRSHVQ